MAKGQAEEGKGAKPANRSNEAVKGLAWRLPVLKTQDLGKIGPGLGVGAGCGVGVGFGLFGGSYIFDPSDLGKIFHSGP